MSFTDLSLFFWRHALLSAIYLLNRISSKSIPTMPYKMWHDKKSSLDYLKIWRCPAYVKRQRSDKLEARSMRANFIKYSKKLLGYYFYFSKDHNMFMSRHAIFLKK